MSSEETDEKRPSTNRRCRYHELFLSLTHKALTNPRLHVTLFFVFVLSAMAAGICRITHLQHRLDKAFYYLDHHHTFNGRCAADPVPPAHVRQAVINRVFNGSSPWDNFPPPHVAPLLRSRDMVIGWGSSDGVFERLIREVRLRTIIEVGMFLGVSTVHMAWLTWQLGLETQILCVDDFRGWPGPVENVPRMENVNGDSVLLYQFMRNMVGANATPLINS